MCVYGVDGRRKNLEQVEVVELYVGIGVVQHKVFFKRTVGLPCVIPNKSEPKKKEKGKKTNLVVVPHDGPFEFRSVYPSDEIFHVSFEEIVNRMMSEPQKGSGSRILVTSLPRTPDQ